MPTCLPAGQIELYTHHPFLPTLVRNLQRLGMRTSAVYLLESQFMEDKYKFFRFVIHLISLLHSVLYMSVFVAGATDGNITFFENSYPS
jgi:hypothetical protein